MSKRSKRKHRKRKKIDAASDISEALKLLRQGNLHAASQLVLQAEKFAKTEREKIQVLSLKQEIRFRKAVKEPEPEKKLAVFTEEIMSAPKDTRLHFHRGIALLQTGKPAEASREFELVFKAEPEREGLGFLRQLAEIAAGKPAKHQQLSEAETNTLKIVQAFQKSRLKKTSAVIPKSPLAGTPQMWSALLRLQHDNTCSEFPAIKELLPSYASTAVTSILTYYQGIAAMRAQEQETACECWTSAMSQGFNGTWGQKNIGLSFREKYQLLLNTEQWHVMAKAARQLPANLRDETVNQMISLALFHIGYEAAQREQWREALTHWTEASQFAHNRYLAQNLALVRERLGHQDKAADDWREMLKRRPRKEGHPDYLTNQQVTAIWQHAGECYLQAREDDEALSCFRKALEYTPDNTALRFKLVSLFMEEEHWNPDEAMRELNGILEKEPENIEALTQLAHLYEDDWHYDPMPLWQKIIALDPNNAEIRADLVKAYLEMVFPEQARGRYLKKKVTYQQQLNILAEAMNVVPDEPDITLSLGIVHLRAGKDSLAREQFIRTYQLAPQDAEIVADVLQNLILVDADEVLNEMIPEIHTIPGLLPVFWVDLGKEALKHPGWAERFFNEALEQLKYSDRGSAASTLVDIYLTLHEQRGNNAIKDRVMRKIREDVPDSGALEYIEAFTGYQHTGNLNNARSLLRNAKKLAQAANDEPLLQLIHGAETILSPGPRNMMNKLLNINPAMLEDLLDELEGLI